jgi:hypothetical protein
MGNITRQDRINFHKNRSGISAGEGTLENLTEGIPQFRTEIDHKTGRQKTVQYIKNGLDVIKSEFKNVEDTGSTIPVISGYPAFSVYQSTSVDEQALATATWTRIQLDTKNYDSGNNFNTTSFKFIVPHNGIYHFDAKILLDGNADLDAGDFDAEERLDVALFKNEGTATTTSNANRMASSLHLVAAAITDSVWEGRLSTDLELNTGDYIELYAWHNSGVEQHTYSNAVDDWTRFTGHLVCAL